MSGSFRPAIVFSEWKPVTSLVLCISPVLSTRTVESPWRILYGFQNFKRARRVIVFAFCSLCNVMVMLLCALIFSASFGNDHSLFCRISVSFLIAGARRDDDGYYWITGRIDDCMNVSGHLLSTAQIESALIEHQAVSEAAVVSLVTTSEFIRQLLF